MPYLRPTNGMSPDGLSYSVATDFDKQMAQALAEVEARTKDPRFVAGARVQEPDTPDLLKRELLDPIMEAEASYQGRDLGRYQRPYVGRAPSIAPHKAANGSWFTFDPTSGQTHTIFEAPTKTAALDAATKARSRLLEADILNRQKALAKLQSSPSTRPEQISDAARGLRLLNDQFNNLFAPQTGTNAPAAVAAPPAPTGFIGSPGGTNKFVTPGGAAGAPPVRRYRYNPATQNFE